MGAVLQLSPGRCGQARVAEQVRVQQKGRARRSSTVGRSTTPRLPSVEQGVMGQLECRQARALGEGHPTATSHHANRRPVDRRRPNSGQVRGIFHAIARPAPQPPDAWAISAAVMDASRLLSRERSDPDRELVLPRVSFATPGRRWRPRPARRSLSYWQARSHAAADRDNEIARRLSEVATGAVGV